jgi:hypothetical protein
LEDGFPILSDAIKGFGFQELSTFSTTTTPASSKSNKAIPLKGIGMTSVTAEKLSNYDFYSLANNKMILMKWKTDLDIMKGTSASPMVQLEAVKNFLNLCQSSLATCDSKMLSMLEQEVGLVHVLLPFFLPRKQPAFSHGYPVVHHDEEIWLKPYIIQILNCFRQSPASLREMSDNEFLKEYLGKVSQVNNPSRLKLIIEDCEDLCKSILYNSVVGGGSNSGKKTNPALNMDFFSPTKCGNVFKNGKAY